MKVGELFAGIGGLGLGCSWAGLGDPIWQLDLTGAAVRARHFDAVQIEASVADVDPNDLERIDVLAGGFSCKGVSTAGKGALLDHPETRVTYLGLLRFAGARPGMHADEDPIPDPNRRWLPRVVVIENTPKMLTRMRALMERHFGILGFGLTWIKAQASDAGAPHLRKRVFVVGIRGAGHRAEVLVAGSGAQDPDHWPTPGGDADDAKTQGPGRESLNNAARQRPWPTPAASQPNESEDHETYAARNARVAEYSRPISEPLGLAVRPWATPVSRDFKVGDLPNRVGTPSLSQQAAPGKRLNPCWVEALMGFPVGWTETIGPRLKPLPRPSWPRGRYPKDWDRTVPWPGFDWEPPRTLPDGPPIAGRPDRLRALGNACCPQHVLVALNTWRDHAGR